MRGRRGTAEWSFDSYFNNGGGVLRQYRRNASTSIIVAAMPPIADPTAIPAMTPVLRPVVAFVVDVDVEVEVEVEVNADVDIEVRANAVLEVAVAIVAVEGFELSSVVAVKPLLEVDFKAGVGDCVDKVEAELLVEGVAFGSTTNPREGIFDAPI